MAKFIIPHAEGMIDVTRKTVLIHVKEENRDDGLWETTIRKTDLEYQTN